MKPLPEDLLASIEKGDFKEPVDDRTVKVCKLLLGYIHENSRDIRRLEDKLDRVDKLATSLLKFAENMFSTTKKSE